MGTSNIGKLRKELARIIEAEIFTINTELSNLQTNIPQIRFKELKHLDMSDLKRLRREIQNLQYNVVNIKQLLDSLKRNNHWGEALSIPFDDETSVIVTDIAFLEAHQTGLNQAPAEVIDNIIKKLNR